MMDRTRIYPAARLENEDGVALVIVLLIVALLTITTVEFADSTNIYAHMTRNSINGMQAAMLARSGINIGEAFLLHDEDPVVDAFSEEWCPEPREESCRIDESFLQLPGNLRLRIEIFDESGKLNINLTRPANLEEAELPDPTRPPLFYAWQEVLQRLFEGNGIDPASVERLNEYWRMKLEANAEMVDAASNTENNPPGGDPQGGQGESGSPTQNLTAAQIDALLDFPSLDDANVALGLSSREIDRMRDFVTALPKRRFPMINANTAPRQVLDALIGDGSITESIVTQRLEAPLQQADWVQLIAGLDTQDPTFMHVRRMVQTRSYMFRVTASALVNPDPTTGLGGIGRTASMLVRRVPRAGRQSGEGNAGHWTLTRVDWQKEGGAKLFVENESQGDAFGVGEDELRFF
jgi:type II secretory pathway component PulK